ncbi:MotA/TolQ/ExbB proton channel family protein [Peredibacter starrii]|uniref:MotA/TolQ/ExbB proton channel family protein n=1 Tax=Peredibacter starrii TaxID=28202 RepID=A0AAX4HMR3_9BACT|nr:MotA/TolQ/ExbB proton channel family protein [Peredibacter starrii]WPU64460.1 MotA/TolQ/ExbB proton channel family protein [Peredibacter starrii]
MHGLNIWQILWDSGLVVKFVLLLLILSSVLSWTIIWQKYKELKAVTEANDKFNDFFKKTNSITEINREANENHDSTMSLMFRRGFDELNKVSEKLSNAGKNNLAQYFADHGFQSLERALKTGYNSANEKMDLRVSTLASIGSITPFIGLFGTVWGIIDAFSGLSQGGGSIEAVAPGIAEALVATAVGLAAAIPAVCFFNLFNNQIARINSQMESFSQDFLNLIERTILIKKD